LGVLGSAIAMLVSLFFLLGCRVAAPGAPTMAGVPTRAPAKTSGAATPEGAPAGIAAGEGAAAAGEGTGSADDLIVVAPVGTTPAEAQALCNDLEDPTTILSCTFVPGGKELPGGGRVELLEIGFDSDMGEMKHVYAVLRVPGEYPQTEQMAEERSIPGEETVYRLEPIALESHMATFRAQETVTTYPNTGDPDEPSGEYDEVAKVVVRCSITTVECDKEIK
jgi:hypothetical protein